MGDSTDPPMPPAPPERITCERCGGVMQLVTMIGRFANQSAYRIFECTPCMAIKWIEA
jgi:hypothetical protein